MLYIWVIELVAWVFIIVAVIRHGFILKVIRIFFGMQEYQRWLLKKKGLGYSSVF